MTLLKPNVKNLFRPMPTLARLCFSFMIFILGCAPKQLVAPHLLPFINERMWVAEYWLSRVDKPDEIVMDLSEIKKFNQQTMAQVHTLNDILQMPQCLGQKELITFLKTETLPPQRNKYNRKNQKISKRFFIEIDKNRNVEAILEKNQIRFALTIKKTNIRGIPTNYLIMDEPYTYGFDIYQYSTIDVGEPLAILHESKDKKWVFIQSAFVRGWVSKKDIVFCPKEVIASYIHKPEFIVITAPRVKIYQDKKYHHFLTLASMGTVFPLKRETERNFLITLPGKDESGQLVWLEGYVNKEFAKNGYLPYTRRNVFLQAFKSLHEPYGWGGVYGFKDCSQFIKDLFACFGIKLPRNSAKQAKVGIPLASFKEKTSLREKKKFLEKAPSAISLLYLKGHIMLYLGKVKDNYYVIHDMWDYGGKDRNIYVGRVVVSTLSLGEESKKGSLLDRLKAIVVIKMPSV
jgi:hypothetical protein